MYFSIKSTDPIYKRLSIELRGRCFRVPFFWKEPRMLSFNDWKKLVKGGLAGKMVYICKNTKIDYRDVIKNNA